MSSSPWNVLKHVGPKLVPFFKSVCVFFVVYPNDEPSASKGTTGTSLLIYMVIKCVPIAALCLFVLMHGMSLQFKYSYSRRIVVGLLFSMIGDACLVYKDNYFLHGIVAFAIAHIIYFTAFGIKPFNMRLALAMCAIFTSACALYIPHLSSFTLKFIVPIYTALLLVMLWRAVSRLFLAGTASWTWPKLCCSLGAFCFLISDSLLSFDLFIWPIPYSHPLIMLTYYSAQLGIALSVVDSYESDELNQLVIQESHVFEAARTLWRKLSPHSAITTSHVMPKHVKVNKHE